MCLVIIDLFNSKEVAGGCNVCKALKLAVCSSITQKHVARVPAAAAAAST
jgi:hypothetical protein